MKFDSLLYAKWSSIVLLASLAAWLFSGWEMGRMPSADLISAEVQREPLQTPTKAEPFTLRRNRFEYHVTPVFDYDLVGLVVSKHSSKSLGDYYHAIWNDYINTADLCVVWGDNVTSNNLQNLSFDHDDFTCWVGTRSREAWAKFRINKLSNNHLIPMDARIGALIDDAEIGDEIHFKGQLVNYSVGKGRPRISSITRDDTGNGACEVVYVREFSTFHRINGRWIRLHRSAKFGMLAGLAALLLSLFVIPFVFRSEWRTID